MLTSKRLPSLGIRALALTLLLSSCVYQQQSAQRADTTSDQQANELEIAAAQFSANMKETCARDEYKVLFLHAACTVDEITSEQLADKSNLVAADKPLFWKIHIEHRVIAAKLITALRLYGGTHGPDVALARGLTDGLLEKNALALYEGTITWGDYNRRRKEIVDTFLEELHRIDPPPSGHPQVGVTLPA